MRILIFSPSLQSLTGSPIRAINIIRGLAQSKIVSDLVVVSWAFSSEFTEEFSCISFQEKGISQTIEEIVRRKEFDAIFCITHGYANVVSSVAKKNGIPFYVDIHGIRSLEICDETSSFREKISSLKECIPWFLGLFNAEKIFCANPMLYKFIKIIFPLKAVPLIGLVRVDDFKTPSIKSNRTRVLYAGNLRAYQGINLFLDAIEILPEKERSTFSFYIIGTVGCDKSINNRLALLQKQNKISLKSAVPYSRFPAILSEADVVVIPRPWSITAFMALPQKIVEAMSAGKCVIATDLAPHRWALGVKPCGIIVRPRARELSLSFLEARKCLKHEYGASARARARELFDVSVQIPRILHHFNN